MSQTAPVSLRVEIWSDVMCPWCVIAWYQLARAREQLSGEIEVLPIWHPFELNPDMPADGEDTADHMLRKYGRPPDAASSGMMRAMARDAGYDMGRTGKAAGDAGALPNRMWNTRDAHVLLQMALARGGPDMQTALKLALFDAHFQRHAPLGDRDVLLAIAEEAGLPRGDAASALADPMLAEAVAAEERAAMEQGVNSVPMMLVEGRFMIPGAQDVETYVASLRKVASRLAEGR